MFCWSLFVLYQNYNIIGNLSRQKYYKPTPQTSDWIAVIATAVILIEILIKTYVLST